MNANEQPIRATEKWKEAGQAGFQILPDLLLKNQSELGLSATDLVVLINLTMHWWYPGQRPFPRSSVIAKRMGVDTRTVQRTMKKLSGLGLVKRVTENEGTSEERVVCDLSGLVDALVGYARFDVDYLARTQRQEEKPL